MIPWFSKGAQPVQFRKRSNQPLKLIPIVLNLLEARVYFECYEYMNSITFHSYWTNTSFFGLIINERYKIFETTNFSGSNRLGKIIKYMHSVEVNEKNRKEMLYIFF